MSLAHLQLLFTLFCYMKVSELFLCLRRIVNDIFVTFNQMERKKNVDTIPRNCKDILIFQNGVYVLKVS